MLSQTGVCIGKKTDVAVWLHLPATIPKLSHQAITVIFKTNDIVNH